MDAADLIDSREIALAGPEATTALGARLGALLKPGDAVCLSGGLGAGKTTLARGAIRSWTGSDGDAPSPAYTLAQVYEGPRGELWHVDLYRLARPEECFELGLDEAFASAACLIEWPERLGTGLPAERLDIALGFAGEGRTARLVAHGRWGARLVAF